MTIQELELILALMKKMRRKYQTALVEYDPINRRIDVTNNNEVQNPLVSIEKL